MIIRCTSKVLKGLQTPKTRLDAVPESADPLEEWYVNLFHFNPNAATEQRAASDQTHYRTLL